jgi:hypothetical protein
MAKHSCESDSSFSMKWPNQSYSHHGDVRNFICTNTLYVSWVGNIDRLKDITWLIVVFAHLLHQTSAVFFEAPAVILI